MHDVLRPVHAVDCQQRSQQDGQSKTVTEQVLQKSRVEADLLAEEVLQQARKALVDHAGEQAAPKQRRARQAELEAELRKRAVPGVLHEKVVREG